jgi:hypothetical protein
LDERSYGLVEGALVFGVVLIFCVQQLVSLRRLRRARERKAEPPMPAPSAKSSDPSP